MDNNPKEGVAFLRRAVKAHPGNFWVNLQLAVALLQLQPLEPSDLEVAIRFAAVVEAQVERDPA